MGGGGSPAKLLSGLSGLRSKRAKGEGKKGEMLFYLSNEWILIKRFVGGAGGLNPTPSKHSAFKHLCEFDRRAQIFPAWLTPNCENDTGI
jgi:hypothetical protein